MIIQPTPANLVMPAAPFYTNPAPPFPTVVELPERPALPLKENNWSIKDASSSQNVMSENEENSAQSVTSDKQAVKNTSEDGGNSNAANSAENVGAEKTPDCDEPAASRTEKDKVSDDLSVSQAQNEEEIFEENSAAQSETLISAKKAAEVPAHDGGWDCSEDGGTEVAGQGVSRVEEEGDTVTHVESDIALGDEGQLLESDKQVKDTKSVINAQSAAASEANTVNNEPASESQSIPAKKKNEGAAPENIPLSLSSQASPVSLCESSPPCTPEKPSPAAPPFPSQHLYLCTPFTTPQKLGDKTSCPTSPSTSPLCTPILTAPFPAGSADEALQGLRQRNLTAELETSEEPHRASSSLVKNVPCSQGQNADAVTGKGRATTPLRRVMESPIIDRSGALVTSVYEVPVLTKERGKGSLRLINITASKPETRHRKISPAKSFRSPMKTSPMKQVSPILRKYHKYSPKKRHIRPGKPLPIMPKLTVSKC